MSQQINSKIGLREENMKKEKIMTKRGYFVVGLLILTVCCACGPTTPAFQMPTPGATSAPTEVVPTATPEPTAIPLGKGIDGCDVNHAFPLPEAYLQPDQPNRIWVLSGKEVVTCIGKPTFDAGVIGVCDDETSAKKLAEQYERGLR